MRRLIIAVLFFSVQNVFPQKETIVQLDSLLNKLSSAKEDTIKVKLFMSISQLYVNNDPKAGMKYAENGLELAKKLNWKRGIANTYNTIGLIVGDTGNNTAAIQYFEKSYEINREMDAKPFMIANLSNMGRCYQRETKFPKASEYYFKALTIAEDSHNDEQAALVGTNIIALFITQQDYKKAAQYVDITIKKGESAHALVHVAKAYELKGVIDEEAKDSAAAILHFEKAIELYQQVGSKMGVVSALSNLGTTYADPAKSIGVFIRVQNILDEIAPSSQNSILNLANLGVTYFNLGQSKSENGRKKYFDSAEYFLKRGDSLSISTNNPEYRADIKQIMSNLEEEKGNYKEALSAFKVYTTITDSIFSQQNKNKIAGLESQRTIDLKNKEIENNQLQIGNQQKRLWLLISIAAFILIAGVLVYRQSEARKKLNIELSKLNYELDEANKVKSKFFGILSHDLRSPVATLVNYLQLQKAKPDLLSAQQKTEHENRIAESAMSLLETMEAMLLWSKGQMDYFKPTISNVPVIDLFLYLKHFFSGSENILFEYIAENEMSIQSDELYLKTIMQNLTSNSIQALKQTASPRISWRAWKRDGKSYLSITDNGPGVNNEKLKALYDETVGTSGKQGLGLHIIRDLAKAINCNISLQKAEGGGAVFVLAI